MNIDSIVQYGALGLLAAVLFWIARYVTNQARTFAEVLDERTKEFSRVLDEKDAYTRELVRETVKLTIDTHGILARMTAKLEQRECPMVMDENNVERT